MDPLVTWCYFVFLVGVPCFTALWLLSYDEEFGPIQADSIRSKD